MEHPDSTPHQIFFRTPFDMNSCTARLENLNEKGSFFAFDWQFRLKAQVWKSDTGDATFKIHYIQKSYMEFTIAPVVVLRGALRDEGSGTQVAAKALTNWIGYAISWGIPGLLLGLWPASILAFQVNVILAVVVAVAVPGIVFVLSTFWLDWRKKQLLGIVTDTLGGPPSL
jgi:hypothetical protein